MTEIITAVISALATLIVCLVNNSAQNKRADAEHAKAMMQVEASISEKIAVLDCKFDDLSEKVERHNGLVERTYKIESDIKVLQEKQSVANNRIKDLEAKTNV